MILVGLTGSIAMGKSETTRMFRAEGIPVFDADECVRELYQKGGDAVSAVGRMFPAAIVDGAIDRSVLSQELLRRRGALKQLENIVHPLVRRAEAEFLGHCRKQNEPLAVLDIPLLFETGRERDVDVTVVVSAPPDVQRERALARPGMTEEKLDLVLSHQVPDLEKRRRAHYVIDTSNGLAAAHADVRRIVAQLREGAGPDHA